MELWELAAKPLPLPAIENVRGAAKSAGPDLQRYLAARWQRNVHAATSEPNPAVKLMLVERAAEMQIVLRELYDDALVNINEASEPFN